MGIPERYLNHSWDPNTVPGEFCDIAARDIPVGEELTTDLESFYIPDGGFECKCMSEQCRGKIGN